MTNENDNSTGEEGHIADNPEQPTPPAHSSRLRSRLRLGASDDLHPIIKQYLIASARTIISLVESTSAETLLIPLWAGNATFSVGEKIGELLEEAISLSRRHPPKDHPASSETQQPVQDPKRPQILKLLEKGNKLVEMGIDPSRIAEQITELFRELITQTEPPTSTATKPEPRVRIRQGAKVRKNLRTLMTALANHVEGLSDEQILEDAAAMGEDVEATGERIRNLLLEAIKTAERKPSATREANEA